MLVECINLPTPPLAEPNTPGISLDMRDLLEQEARNECENGEGNRGNDDHTMRMDEIGQSETKRNTKHCLVAVTKT